MSTDNFSLAQMGDISTGDWETKLAANYDESMDVIDEALNSVGIGVVALISINSNLYTATAANYWVHVNTCTGLGTVLLPICFRRMRQSFWLTIILLPK